MAGEIKEASLDELFSLDETSSNLTGDISLSGMSLQTESVCDPSSALSNEVVFTLKVESKEGKTATDTVKSSPCSPTISFLSEFAMPSQRQRSYSDSGDKLNPQDRAFLEEIERGSQLTLEDQELFDLLSKKKFDTDGLLSSECGSSRDGTSFNLVDKPETLQDSDNKSTSLMRSGSSALKQLLLSNTTSKQKIPKVIRVSVNRAEKKVKSIADGKIAANTVSTLTKSKHNVQVSTPQQTEASVKSGSELKSQTIPQTPVQETGVTQSVYAVQFDDGKGNEPINLYLPEGVMIQDGYIVFPPNAKEASSTVTVPTTIPENIQLARKQSDQSNQDIIIDKYLKVFVCEECGVSFEKPSKLNIHVMAKHTGERPFKCDFPGCTWAFTANYKLKRHKECHDKKKECVCPVNGCGKLFSTVYNLNQHLRLHSRPQNHICPACSAAFGTRKKLDAHMKTHGEQYKNYNCPVEGCDKMFYSELCMGSHLKMHEKNRHYVCEFEGCGREFTQLCKLTAHERTHTKEKPFACPYPLCSARFSTSSHVARHLKTHTNQRNYVCQQCGKAFLRAEHLRGHMASHSGARPFVCFFPECKAAFSAKSTLYLHMKRHPRCEASPHVCPLEGCKERFNDKTSLRRHIDQHYGRESQDEAPKEKRQKLLPVSSTPLPKVTSPPVVKLEASNDATNTMAFLNVTFNGNASESGQVLLTPELANSLIASSGVSMVTNEYLKPEQAQEMVESNQAAVNAEQAVDNEDISSEGCARTDYHRNHLMSVKVKKRRMILKQKAAQAGFDLASFQEIANNSPLVSGSYTDVQDATSGPVMNPNEVMTSRAITIRDPETGAVYVQTQLLQDDPPNMEFEESAVETGSAKSILPDYRALIEDANFSQALTAVNDANVTSQPATSNDMSAVIWETSSDQNESSAFVTYSIVDDSQQIHSANSQQSSAILGDSHLSLQLTSDKTISIVPTDESTPATFILSNSP